MTAKDREEPVAVRYFCPTCRVQYEAPGACRRCNAQLKECEQCPSGRIEETTMAKPAIRMQAIKIIGWGCLGLVIGSILTLAGGLTWRNHREELGALAISVLGMVILLGAVWRVLLGTFQAVSGRRTGAAIETLKLPAESATTMAGSEHAVASSSTSGKRDEATTAFSAMSKGCSTGCGTALLLGLATCLVLTVLQVPFNAGELGSAFGGLGVLFACIGVVVGLVRFLRRRRPR